MERKGKKGYVMRLVSDFEIVIKRLVSKELRKELKYLRETHGSCLIDGVGSTSKNFKVRFIIKNDVEGLFVLHKLIELSGGFYEAYARVFITDSDIPTIRHCDGARDHKSVYTTNENCPICGRKTKKCNTLNKEAVKQLKDLKVSIDDL
jgi:tRNA U54 and U55 pseudouridine synthase Pus10